MKNFFTIYSTSKQVQIKSTCLAIIYLVMVITVLCAYLGSLKLDIRKIYQKSCPAKGAVVSKVKGVISTKDIPDSKFQVSNPSIYKRVWDVSDVVVPPYGGDGQDGSFVVFTNLIVTQNQSRGLCLENNSSKQISCNKDEECPRGKISPSTNGIFSGKCIDPSCELLAWCPIEQPTTPLKTNRALLEDVKDFTVMIKNSVEFPECGGNLRRRNILEDTTKDYLSQCRYDNKKNVFCPIFRLGDIISWSGHEFSNVAVTGGVFTVQILWDCDFDDFSWIFVKPFCFPTYHFSRTDVSTTNVSPGWNFRRAVYHDDNRRTLQKVFGLKFLVTINGEGKSFDIFTLILTMGATVGLFALAPLVCDYLFRLLCVLKKFQPFTSYLGNFSIKTKYERQQKPEKNQAEIAIILTS